MKFESFDVDEFVSSSLNLEKFSTLAMGAIRMKAQISDKNITVIHKYSSPSINVLWSDLKKKTF